MNLRKLDLSYIIYFAGRRIILRLHNIPLNIPFGRSEFLPLLSPPVIVLYGGSVTIKSIHLDSICFIGEEAKRKKRKRKIMKNCLW